MSAVILLNSSSSRSELSDGATGALAAGELWANQPMSKPKTNSAEVPSRYLRRTRTREGVSKRSCEHVFFQQNEPLGNHMRDKMEVNCG